MPYPSHLSGGNQPGQLETLKQMIFNLQNINSDQDEKQSVDSSVVCFNLIHPAPSVLHDSTLL